MKYTKEDIERFKSDPFVKLLHAISGVNIDDIIKEIEKENPGDGELTWSPEKGTEKKSNKEELLKRVDNPKYSISSAALLGIIQMLIDVKKSVRDLSKQGLEIEAVTAFYKLEDVVHAILTSIYGEAAFILMDVSADDIAKHVLIEFEANLHE